VHSTLAERFLRVAAAFLGVAIADVVDDEAAHDSRRVAEEPVAIEERDVFASRDV
jgi:hypothetical protein